MIDHDLSRRKFIQRAGVATSGLALAGRWPSRDALAGALPAGNGRPLSRSSPETGSQRLTVAKLQAWEELGYGMFTHFGMSTFVGDELPEGKAPATTYNPDQLDVDQWIQIARDAGMKYAVLTAKHVAGHCLWPSRHTDYTVAHSGNRTDVIGAFVKACQRRGVS